MADEGLDFIIGVVVDGVDQVQPSLEKVESLIGGSVDRSNSLLEKLGNVEVLQGLMKGAETAVLSLKDIDDSVVQTNSGLLLLRETVQALQSGGFHIGGIESLRELQGLMRESITIRPPAGLSQIGTEAASSTARIAELEASLLRLRDQSGQTGEAGSLTFLEKLEQGLVDLTGRRLVLTQELVTLTRELAAAQQGVSVASASSFFSEIDPLAVERAMAQERAAEEHFARSAQEARLSQVKKARATESALANVYGAPIDPVADLEAIQAARQAGLLSFRGSSTIQVHEPFEGVNGVVQPGFYEAATGTQKTGLQAEYLNARYGTTEQTQAAIERLEAMLSELRAAEVARSVDPLAPFRSEGGEVNFTAAAARQAALNSAVAATRLARTDENDPEKLARAEAAAIGAATAEERKSQALDAQGTLYERIAALQEQLVGLSDKEAQATLAVLAAKARIAEANEAGVVSETQLISLARQLEAAEARLLATREKEAEAAARTAAGGGRGGFFGQVGRGFFGGGFGGGEGRPPIEEAGFQLGLVAQYTLYYQIFREIEDAIKSSVDEALQFDRAVTDMANRLQISEDAARGLADQVGQLGAVGGLGPAETIGYATSYAGVFAGQASQPELLTTGAQTAAQIQVLTGNLKDDMPDVISTVRAFNLSFQDTQRVMDAATSAAQNYGLANQSAVLPGLAQIGDLAAQSGFSLEQTANLIADIQTRTNDSSEAVAGELQRFLGRTGTPAFQAVFSNLGISGTDFNDQLSKLSDRFDKLSDSQKRFIVSEFGGGRAGVAALAYIEDYNRVLDNTNKSLNEGGVAYRNYAQRLNDIVGIITSVRGELKELAKDVGTSGIGAGFGIALETLKPFVELLDEAVRLLNQITGLGGGAIPGISAAHGKDFQSLLFGGAEIAGLIKLLQGTNVGDRVKGLFGRGGAAETPTSVAADATAQALNRLTVAVTEATSAVEKDTVATTADEAAKVTDTAATTADEAAKVEDLAATTADSASKLRDAVAGAAGTIGLATSSILGRIGLTGGEALGIGLGGALVVQQTYDAAKAVAHGVSAGQAASDDAFNVDAADAAALQDKVQHLREAASQAESSSAGPWRTVENYIAAFEGRSGKVGEFLHRIPVVGHLFGGNDINPETTGDVASRLRVQANLLATEAARARQAQGSAYSAGDFSSQIDLTNQGGVANGLKALAARGLDSEQQLDALNEKLAEFAREANGAAAYIANGTAKLTAQNYANAATNDLVQSGGKFGSKDFQENVAPGLNEALAGVAEQFLGPLQGGNFSKQNGLDLEAQAQARITSYLAANGFSADDLKENARQIHEAAGAAVQQAVAQANAAHGAKISPDAVGGVAAALPQLIAGTEQKVTTLAQLGQAAAPEGTTVAGLRAALKKAQNTYNSLKASGADSTTLEGIAQEIDTVKVQLQTAVVANLDAQAQLAAASIPPENTTEQIEAHLAALRKEIAATKNPDELLKLRTDLRKTRAQLAASEAQDRISGIGIDDNVDDAVQQAKDALRRAKATLKDDRERGVKGAALNQAIAQVHQARYAYAQAVVESENAETLAGARAGDPLAQARAQLEAAERTLASDTAGTTKYYQDLAAVHEAQESLAQQIAKGATDAYLLSGDTTDPVAQALSTLVGARRQLTYDRQHGVGSLSSDRLTVEQAEQAAQKSRFDQRLQDQRTAYDLNRESAAQYLHFLDRQHDVLVHQLAGMKKGAEGYRQLVDELNTVDEAIHAIDGSLAGQFNLGDIRVPTVYQVRESLVPGGTLGPAGRHNVEVTVIDKTEGGVKAKAVLSSALGGHTVSRTGMTPRKVRR